MAQWKHHQDDDFFGDLDDESSPGRRCEDGHELDSGLMAHESKAEAERFRTIGYHEAYDLSQEVRLQEGFEAGYTDTFDVAASIGELLGRAAMKAQLGADTDATAKVQTIGQQVRAFLVDQDKEKDLQELADQVEQQLDSSL